MYIYIHISPLLQSGSLKDNELTWSGKQHIKLVQYLVLIIDKNIPQHICVF